MKKILLVTDGIFHPTLLGRRALRKALEQMDGFSFTHVPSLEKLPADIRSFSAFVLHYHHKKISTLALKKLQDYVSQGGGILAIHAATASFKECLPYFVVLGGRFIGHERVENFEMKKLSENVFQGMQDFSVKDELYIHELQPEIEVHFTTQYKGREVPVVWTYQYGKGKICYAAPGHTTATMRNKIYQQLLQTGLRWVTE